MGLDEAHLKLFVKQSRPETSGFGTEGIAAIGFGLGNKINLVTDKKPFDAVYCLDENEWNGKVTIQLRLRDIK
jgi:single-stranded-DNA-specific exonuclease